MTSESVPTDGTRATRLGGNFWRYATAYTGIALADGVRLAALPLLAASVSRVPLAVAVVAFAETLPWLVVSLPIGVFVDRHDRRRLMQGAALARVLLMTFLIGVILAGQVSIPLLAVVGFLLGCSDTLGSNCAIGLVRGLVATSQLERANGVVGGVESIASSLVGPALGGLLFTVASFVPFAVDAFAVLLAASLLVSVKGQFKAAAARSERAGMWREMVEGVRWLLHHRALRSLSLLVAASNLAFGMVFGILVLFVLEVMHLPQVTYGPLLASLAVGGLMGALLGARFGKRWRTPVALSLILAAQGVAVAAAGALPVLGVVVAGFVIAGLGAAIWDVIVESFRQLVVPDPLLGRVTSGFRLIGIGSAPLGTLLGGVSADAFGLRSPFFLAAGVLAVASVFAAVLLHAEDFVNSGS